MSASAIAKGKIELTISNIEFARADHGFFCDERASYEPHSARQAYALTLEFLRT